MSREREILGRRRGFRWNPCLAFDPELSNVFGGKFPYGNVAPFGDFFPPTTIFSDPFGNAAGDFVANRTVAKWPTASYAPGSAGVNFDGLGNVQGIYTAGQPIMTAVSPQQTFNVDKRHILTVSGAQFLQFQNGTSPPRVAAGCECDNTGATVVGFEYFIGTGIATGRIRLDLGGAVTDDVTLPSTPLATPQAVVLDVGAWNGVSRTIRVSVGGVVRITRTTAIRGGANKAQAFTIFTGNGSTPGNPNIQIGTFAFAAYPS